MRSLLLFPLLAGCVAIEANERADLPSVVKQAIVPPGMEGARDQLHYSPAVRTGDFVYAAGVVAGLRPGESGDAAHEAAYERAFQNIARTLAASGASWDDVVDIVTYHTDLPGQIRVFATVKDRYVKEPYPAWTAIDIDRLYPDNGLVEIKVVARVGAAPPR